MFWWNGFCDFFFFNFPTPASYIGCGTGPHWGEWCWVMRFGVWGLRLKVLRSEVHCFEVWGSRFKVWGLRFKVQGLRSEVQGFEVWSSRFDVWDSRLRGLRFKVGGLRLKVWVTGFTLMIYYLTWFFVTDRQKNGILTTIFFQECSSYFSLIAL